MSCELTRKPASITQLPRLWQCFLQHSAFTFGLCGVYLPSFRAQTQYKLEHVFAAGSGIKYTQNLVTVLANLDRKMGDALLLWSASELQKLPHKSQNAPQLRWICCRGMLGSGLRGQRGRAVVTVVLRLTLGGRGSLLGSGREESAVVTLRCMYTHYTTCK